MKLVLVVAAFALSGCLGDPVDPGDGHHNGDHHGDPGGHHGDPASDGTLPVDGSEDRLVNVTAGSPSEYRFTPDRIEVESGQRVAIAFDNAGQVEHEFAIPDLEFHLHAAPGGSDSGAFIAPAPGEYTFGCYLPGHFEAGMQGTLVVT